MAAYTSTATLPKHIAERLKTHRVTRSMRRSSRVYHDTTDFTSIDYGDLVKLEDKYFLITAYTKEGRFGVDEQIKPWVPKTEELGSGEKFILKLVFHENFDIKLGPFTITCYRTPDKEAKVLELVKENPFFMHGEALNDQAGNLVRIIEPVNGNRLDKVIHRSQTAHREYFFNELPTILREFLHSLEAIAFLHSEGIRHGDIRRDHIFVERKTGRFRWIDFDYDFHLPERPFALDLFELGNILVYLTAKGDYHPREVLADPSMGQEVLQRIGPGDFSLLAENRIVNIQKLFPYIPDELNNILLHFSTTTNVFYETVEELHQDLDKAIEAMERQKG